MGKKPVEVEGIRTELVYSDPQNEFMITRLPDAWPRAYWVPAATIVSDYDEGVHMLDSLNLRKTVIITTKGNIPIQDQGDYEITPVIETSYEPDHVVLNTDTNSPGWLVLSDRYYPGWRAFIDGEPVKIYKANVIVRAIPLKPGKHIVDFVYRPVTLRLGMMVSMISWIVLMAWSLKSCGNKLRSG
jgi:hypothetical protein